MCDPERKEKQEPKTGTYGWKFNERACSWQRESWCPYKKNCTRNGLIDFSKTWNRVKCECVSANVV